MSDGVEAAVVAAARGWLGTPYCHQASLRGAGADCLGLIRGVWREVVGPEPGPLPTYDPGWAESGDGEALWQGMALHFVLRPVSSAAPGEVLLFRMRARSAAKHLGIAVPGAAGPGFIHAYVGHGVVESALTGPWARRVVARFAFPRP